MTPRPSTPTSSSARPPKAGRDRDAVRRKAAAARQEAARREARRRTVIVTVAAAIVLGIVASVVVVVQSSRRDAAVADARNPANVSAGNAIVVGDASAPVTMTVYEDFQCPACRSFEELNGAQVKQWIADKTVKVEYQPIAFLDRASTDRYSTRSLNAAAAVVDAAPTAFPAFHDALFANQPAEGGAGLTDAKLVELAVAAGAPQAQVEAAVEDGAFEGWVARVTEAASQAGVNSTPTVKVDGKTLESFDPTVVKQAVEAAKVS